MQSREIFRGLFIAAMVIGLAACTAPVDRIVKDRGVIDGIMLDEKGGLTVIEAVAGQVVPSCRELEKTDRKCKYHFGKDQVPADIKIIRDTRIRIISYVGSNCNTYVDEVTGEEYEVCRPPYSKR